tara:strand:+ start:96 stop:1307 length:1212 start_codon:yes stop_codon:yes gene_type:complete
MKKSQLRKLIKEIIREQLSTGTEIYSTEGCEKVNLYNYIMTSGNYPTYDGTTGSYPNFTNDQVVLFWCGRCQAAQNENGSYSFVMQVQPPQDEPNCKCCPQFENIDWPGEPEEPDTDIPFRDPNKDVPFKPPKPPRPDFPFKDPDKFIDDQPEPPRPDFPFKDPLKFMDDQPEPPIPPRPERPITPITLGDDSDDFDFDINMNYGAWYCAGDALLEVDPSVTSTDCAYIANYDNPNNITGYPNLQSCIAASTCTGPAIDEVDDDQFTWTNEEGEVISCTSDEGSNTVNDEFCNECVDAFDAAENIIVSFAKTSIQFDGFGVGSFEGEPIPSLPSWTWQGIYNLFNGTNQSGIYNSAYCTCCDNWQAAVVDLIGDIQADILDSISLEESVKARLQKLAGIRKNK